MDSAPNRQFMDDPGITWRTEKPDYTKANAVFARGKSKHHPSGSLARIVEDLVKTFEMEATHKIDPKDWQSVDVDEFKLTINGIKSFDVATIIERGTYNCFLEENPLYTGKNTTLDESFAQFEGAFTEGFPWELLEVYGSLPTVAFTWRHWATYSGPYRGHPPTGETLELIGSTIATVNDKGRLIHIQMFFDTAQFMSKLNQIKCPLMIG